MRLENQIATFISDTCDFLDNEKFSEFLSICSSDFEYSVTAYSPDLGKDMVWLDHDRIGFEQMVKMLPEHVRSKTKLNRHPALVTFTSDENGRYETKTKVAIFQTDLIGTSAILAIGTYIDTIELADDGRPLLASRRVQLDTRDLGPGVCVPL